tara:strand:+ start:40 stop:1602 length:1563 start_codon:yes stop_codon:yes gene_type:complete
MKSFKTFLVEGMSTEVSTALETVLGLSWEAVVNKNDQILLDAMKSNKQFKTAKKYWDTGNEKLSLKNLKILGEKIVKSDAAPSGTDYKFQEGGSISKFWKDNGGRNNTAKADIILGNRQYSVKNADGAQLMSGKKGESSATAAAAAEAIGISDFAQDLIKSIKKLETVTTKGYYASADNLKRLKQNANQSTTLYMLASALDKESKRYDKEFAKYKKDKAKLKKKKDKKGEEKLDKEWLKAWPPNSSGSKKIGDKFKFAKKGWSKIGTLGSKGKPSLGRDLPKVLAKGKQSKELQTKINIENKKFTDFVDGKFDKNAKEVEKKLYALFENADYQREFCYEAASGSKKFGKAPQTANSMLSWAPTNNAVQDFKVKTYPMTSSKAKIIGLYAAQMKLDVNWKSSSTSGHKGYNLYQNIRLGLGKLIEETNHAQDTLFEEYNQLKNSLHEGIINEGAFFSKIKSMAKGFISTIKEFGKRILNWFKEAIEKVKSAASEGITALGSVLGFEMDVNTNADQELSISI